MLLIVDVLSQSLEIISRSVKMFSGSRLPWPPLAKRALIPSTVAVESSLVRCHGRSSWPTTRTPSMSSSSTHLDPYTQRVVVIDKPASIKRAVDDVRNQLSVVSSALRKLHVTWYVCDGYRTLRDAAALSRFHTNKVDTRRFMSP